MALGAQKMSSRWNSASSETAKNNRQVELALAEHGRIFTKIKFTFTIEAVTLSLLTGGRGLERSSSVSSASSNVSRPSYVSALDAMPMETALVVSEDSPSSKDTSLQRVSLSGLSKTVIVSQFGRPLEEGNLRRLSNASVTGPAYSRSLAEFSLQVVTVKGQMMSDGSLGANLVLFDCILHDTRPGREKYITRMMERKKQNGSNMGMIDLTYKQGSTNDTFVDLRISGFVLVLHLPYLLSIQRFFTENMPSKKTEEKQSLAYREVKQQKSVTLSDNEGRPTSLMTVRVKLEKPDIVLIEDLTNEHSPCIILHAEVGSDIKINPTNQNIGASITNIHMYQCCFHPGKRQQTMSEILSRCEISFMSVVTPLHAEHIDVRISHIDLRVSPGVRDYLF
ncbi:hypothetical protein SK128_013370 [Halocaridina rubra]|uniref:VPS13-like middle region domain-containing protein n=1 Tax=Halocaridina rubra TaxID=373956 RepID=A0AAN8WQL7_HALRR